MRTNNNEIKALSQVFKHKTLYDPNPIRSLRINPAKHMIDSKRYSWLELACLDVLLDRANKKGYVAYTHEDVGDEVGCHPVTVQSTERKAQEDNILLFQRNFKRKTLGRVSSFFGSTKVKKSLGSFLPSLAIGVFVGYNLLQTVRPIDNINPKLDIYKTTTTKTMTNLIYSGFPGSSNGFNKTFQKKEIVLEIPNYIKEIMAIDFTLAGQACASIFSERIVREIDSSMLKKHTTITNPLSYFFSTGHSICKKRNISPDYELRNQLHKHFGTTDEMPLLKSLGKNPNPLMMAMPKQVLKENMKSYTTTPRKPLPTGKPANFNCPCHYRRKFQPDYVCYGVWCAQQELENLSNIIDSEPYTFGDTVSSNSQKGG